MKTLPLVLWMLMAVCASAQTTKPTKDQTVAYLKDYFKKPIRSCRIVTDNGNLINNYEIRDQLIDINASDCSMVFSYRSFLGFVNIPYHFNETKLEGFKYKIDLQNIESIALSVFDREGCYSVSARFTAAPGKTIERYSAVLLQKEGASVTSDLMPVSPVLVSQAEIPVAAYQCKDCAIDEQIISALNHLRKLCGAPEPRKF